MASEKKGSWGGARPGAGRPKKEETETVVVNERDPLQFLLDVMQGLIEPTPSQLKAAQAAAQYVHAKKGEGGKKEQKQEAANKVASRFAPAAPPKLVAAGGKKV
jgi:phage terminase small subunit